jgi:hypothetical protein
MIDDVGIAMQAKTIEEIEIETDAYANNHEGDLVTVGSVEILEDLHVCRVIP